MEFKIENKESNYTKWVKENGQFLKRFIEECLIAQNNLEMVERNGYDFEIKLPKDNELMERDEWDDYKRFASEILSTYKNQPLDLIIDQGNVIYYSKYRYISSEWSEVENISLIKPINGVDMIFEFSFKVDRKSKKLLLYNFKYIGENTDDLEDLEEFNNVYTFNEFAKKFK